jgi:membrane associated rhomboid family serine protease
MFGNLTPVVRALLIANVIVYALQRLTGFGDLLLWEFALWPLGAASQGGAPFEPWQLVSYAFLHDPASVLHIASNMLALFMFGPDTERVLGARRFAFFYFACVIGAALTQLLVAYWADSGPAPTLGASGGIFGILLLYGMAFPHRRLLLLFPPIPMPAWLFVTLYGIWELMLGVSGSNQGVAHFAHLGGMATGYVLIRYWRGRGARPQ